MELPLPIFEELFKDLHCMKSTKAQIYNLVSLIGNNLAETRTNRELMLWVEQCDFDKIKEKRKKFNTLTKERIIEYIVMIFCKIMINGIRKELYSSPWDLHKFILSNQSLLQLLEEYGTIQENVIVEFCIQNSSSLYEMSDEFAYGIVLGSEFQIRVTPQFILEPKNEQDFLKLPLPTLTPLIYSEVLEDRKLLALKSSRRKEKSVKIKTLQVLFEGEKKEYELGYISEDFIEGYIQGQDEIS